MCLYRYIFCIIIILWPEICRILMTVMCMHTFAHAHPTTFYAHLAILAHCEPEWAYLISGTGRDGKGRFRKMRVPNFRDAGTGYYILHFGTTSCKFNPLMLPLANFKQCASCLSVFNLPASRLRLSALSLVRHPLVKVQTQLAQTKSVQSSMILLR